MSVVWSFFLFSLFLPVHIASGEETLLISYNLEVSKYFLDLLWHSEEEIASEMVFIESTYSQNNSFFDSLQQWQCLTI